MWWLSVTEPADSPYIKNGVHYKALVEQSEPRVLFEGEHFRVVDWPDREGAVLEGRVNGRYDAPGDYIYPNLDEPELGELLGLLHAGKDAMLAARAVAGEGGK
jgi:hypothetical protein